MATVALDASLRTLNQAVTDRLADEEMFKRDVYDKINAILGRLNLCASGLASSPAPAIAATGVDLARQVRELNDEVRRLQTNRLSHADSEYVTQPLRAEANNNSLRWDTATNKAGFRPADYAGSPSGPPPPYPGSGSGGLASGPSSSGLVSGPSSSGLVSGPSSSGLASGPSSSGLVSGPSMWGPGSAGVPSLSSLANSSVPNSRGSSSFAFPSLPSFPSFSPSRGAEGVKPIVAVRGTNDPRNRNGGWSPRRTPRRTPRRSPKKKTYRR
jgi:hypothetical protein